MKRYSNRPALTVSAIFGKIVRNTICVEAITISGLPIFRLIDDCYVYQSWLSQSTGNITKTHASTYLRKGLFLIPIWQKVLNWQMAYYETHKTDLTKESIYSFENKWYRACYMQVEDIDHAIRQQKHIAKKYASINFQFLYNIDNQSKITEILSHIKSRQKSLTIIKKQAKQTLNSYQRSLKSIIDHSPLFVSHNTKNKKTIINMVRRIATACRSYNLCFRPIFRHLQYASHSLDCSIKYLENNHLKSARKLIESALRNLEYPDPA